MKAPGLYGYTLAYLLFLYAPIALLPISAFNDSVVVAFPRLESLFFVTSICGLGFLFFHVAVHQAVGLIGTDRERMRNFSLLALAFSTSSFLGPMMAGFCID